MLFRRAGVGGRDVKLGVSRETAGEGTDEGRFHLPGEQAKPPRYDIAGRVSRSSLGTLWDQDVLEIHGQMGRPRTQHLELRMHRRELRTIRLGQAGLPQTWTTMSMR